MRMAVGPIEAQSGLSTRVRAHGNPVPRLNSTNIFEYKRTPVSRFAWARNCAIAAILFGATGARAADFAAETGGGAPPPLPGVSWDGFYVGANVGLSDGRDRWSDPSGWFAKYTRRLPASGASIGQFSE